MKTEPAILINEQWQDVPGARDTRIFSCIRKPNVTSSNVFILTIGNNIAFFDTGASQDGMSTAFDALTSCKYVVKNPSLLYLDMCIMIISMRDW